MDGRINTSRDASQILLSVVIPVYNEAAVIKKLAAELFAAIKTLGGRFEVLFINDGSTDESDAILDQIATHQDGVRVLHLSRNFGQQAAVQAGIEHAQGDIIVLMDADLQDDPSILPQFLEKWKIGYDVVYAVRVSRKENRFQRSFGLLFLPVAQPHRRGSSAAGRGQFQPD